MSFARRFTAPLLTVCLLMLSVFTPYVRGSVMASTEENAPLIIIDPGHGGADAGAVGASGSLEKDVNLAVAMELAARFQEAGVPVLLTRTADTLVLKQGEDVKGERKKKDLYNRSEVANAYPQATLVSIHMNSFPVEKYRGLQVYYNEASKDSALLAQRITDRVKTDLDPVYTRVPSSKGDAYYLLKHAVGRAVLIECGFLSNPEEEAKLLEKDYQKKLSFCIFYAIMEE